MDTAGAVSCVEYLATQGLVDGKRAGIRGGSGGGHCTSQALWMYPDALKGGVSEYGVSPLETAKCGEFKLLTDIEQVGNMKVCHEQTHKLESHCLYTLIFNNDTLTEEEKDKIWEGGALFSMLTK